MTKKLPADFVHVQEIMTSICDKWALLILQQLSQGTKRHGELQRALAGISQKMLTQTLRRLESHGLVERTAHAVLPPRVDYSLTRLGGTLTTPLYALYRWTEAHLSELQQGAGEVSACSSPAAG
jgi:DNA-binding HxlR family transcriptional regulator